MIIYFLRAQSVIVTVILVVFMQSCVYQTDQLSELNVQKPSASHAMNIDLSANTDSILILGETSFKYDVNTFGKDFTAIEVNYLNTKYILTDSTSGTIGVTPNYNDTTWFDLTIKFYASTGSGSIADHLKAENYVGSKTWKVKWVNVGDFKFKVRHRVSSDSLVEVYYLNPHNVHEELGTLTNIFNNKMTLTRQHGDTLFYIDSDYYGGLESYTLAIDKYVGFTRYYDYALNYSYPTMTVTDINKDSCLVSWKFEAPIKFNYELQSNNKTVYRGRGHSFKDVQPVSYTTVYWLRGYSPFNTTYTGWYTDNMVIWGDHHMYVKKLVQK